MFTYHLQNEKKEDFITPGGRLHSAQTFVGCVVVSDKKLIRARQFCFGNNV